MKIVDLTVTIGPDTLSPPSANLRLNLTSFHRGPGFWQASKVEMLLHTGSHVDFPRHVKAEGETAADISLDHVCGEALVVDVNHAGPSYGISRSDVEKYSDRIRRGDIVLVRTGWSEKMWGKFPDYYVKSPYCEAEAAEFFVDLGVKAVGFDCFPEYAARLPNFTSEDFILHKILLENDVILMQQLTNLSMLP